MHGLMIIMNHFVSIPLTILMFVHNLNTMHLNYHYNFIVNILTNWSIENAFKYKFAVSHVNMQIVK